MMDSYGAIQVVKEKHNPLKLCIVILSTISYQTDNNDDSALRVPYSVLKQRVIRITLFDILPNITVNY